MAQYRVSWNIGSGDNSDTGEQIVEATHAPDAVTRTDRPEQIVDRMADEQVTSLDVHITVRPV